jgi:hypothetical protein
LTQVKPVSREGSAFEHHHEQEQGDRDVHYERMESAQELREFGSLLAVRRGVDQQNQ